MSDDDRPSSSADGRRWRLAGAIVLVVLLALLLLRGRQDETADAIAIAPPSTGFNGSPSPFARSSSPVAGVPEPGPAASADAADDAVPEGVDPEQWQRVLEALADHPQREAELQRLAAFMRYSSRLEAFRAQRQAGVPAEQLRALARELDAGLDERVERGEVTPEEAILIRTALLESLAAPAAGSR